MVQLKHQTRIDESLGALLKAFPGRKFNISQIAARTRISRTSIRRIERTALLKLRKAVLKAMPDSEHLVEGAHAGI